MIKLGGETNLEHKGMSSPDRPPDPLLSCNKKEKCVYRFKSIAVLLALSLFALNAFSKDGKPQIQKIVTSQQALIAFDAEDVALQIKRADINRDNNRLRANKEFLNDPKNKSREVQHNGHTDTQYASEEIAKRAIEAQNFTPTAEMVRPSKLSSGGKNFKLSDDTTQISVPKSRGGRVSWESKRKYTNVQGGIFNINIGLPLAKNNKSKPAEKTSNDTVVYTAEGENTSVAVQVFEGGIRMLAILNNEQAPTEVVYSIGLTSEDYLELDQQSENVLVRDIDQNIQAIFSSAWAIDANGKEIATHYEIRGNDLVQIINHLAEPMAYPVVTDPYLGVDLISSAIWRGSSFGNANMSVIPTVAGRLIGNTVARNYGWPEIRSKVNVHQWGNAAGLLDQYVCHVFLALEHEYNLEPRRPNAGWLHTIVTLCNPSGSTLPQCDSFP